MFLWKFLKPLFKWLSYLLGSQCSRLVEHVQETIRQVILRGAHKRIHVTLSYETKTYREREVRRKNIIHVIAIGRMSHSLVRITVCFPSDHCLAETCEKGKEGALFLPFQAKADVVFSEASGQ